MRNVLHTGRSGPKTYLYERIALFVVELHGDDGIAGRSCRETLFSHLLIEEVCQVLLIARQLDIANVESLALTHGVPDACHGTGETRSVTGEARVAKHGWNRLTVRTGSRELAYVTNEAAVS